MEPTVPLDCVAFLLVSQGQVLVEKRTLTKRLAPGALAEEADVIVWLPLDAVDRLDFDVDRTAVNEYVRLEREGGLAWRTNR